LPFGFVSTNHRPNHLGKLQTSGACPKKPACVPKKIDACVPGVLEPWIYSTNIQVYLNPGYTLQISRYTWTLDILFKYPGILEPWIYSTNIQVYLNPGYTLQISRYTWTLDILYKYPGILESWIYSTNIQVYLNPGYTLEISRYTWTRDILYKYPGILEPWIYSTNIQELNFNTLFMLVFDILYKYPSIQTLNPGYTLQISRYTWTLDILYKYPGILEPWIYSTNIQVYLNPGYTRQNMQVKDWNPGYTLQKSKYKIGAGYTLQISRDRTWILDILFKYTGIDILYEYPGIWL